VIFTIVIHHPEGVLSFNSAGKLPGLICSSAGVEGGIEAVKAGLNLCPRFGMVDGKDGTDRYF